MEEVKQNQTFPLILDLQTFADGGDEDKPEINDGANDSKGGDEGGDGDGKLTLTQEEFDRIIAERLARQQKKFADYDELKSKIAEYEAAEEERKKAAMTEKERLEAEKAEALRKAEEAESKTAEALQRANERLIRAEFRLLAKEAGIRSDALDDAFKLADLSEVEVTDDGEVKGVDVVVSTLKETKPFLLDQPKPKPKEIGDGSNHDSGGDDEIKVLEQQLEEARKKRNVSKVIEISNKIKSKLAGLAK